MVLNRAVVRAQGYFVAVSSNQGIAKLSLPCAAQLCVALD